MTKYPRILIYKISKRERVSFDVARSMLHQATRLGMIDLRRGLAARIRRKTARDIYVVSIPRGEFPRSWSRAAISRYIRDRVSGFPGTPLQGVKVWPETRAETARVAAASGIGAGPGGAPFWVKPPRVTTKVVSPGTVSAPPGAVRHYGRKLLGALSGLGRATEPPAPRAAGMVRTHVRRRPVARKRP